MLLMRTGDIIVKAGDNDSRYTAKMYGLKNLVKERKYTPENLTIKKQGQSQDNAHLTLEKIGLRWSVEELE